MDIRQLETFLWIARLGSIADACKRLNVTQSTLSMRLRALENNLQVSLFDRNHKRLTLTAKGRDLIRYAEKIVNTARQARMYVADPQALTGTIRIGVAELIALTWLPDLINRMQERFPNITLDLDVGVPRPLTDALSTSVVDMALVPSILPPQPPLLSLSVGSVRFCWMSGGKVELPQRQLTPQDLEDRPLIGVANSQSVFYAVVEQWFIDGGASLRRYSPCNSLAATISMVAEGIGIGLLPLEYCAPLIAAGKLRLLDTDRQFDFEYFAVCSAHAKESLAWQIAELSRQASTFDIVDDDPPTPAAVS